MAIDLHRFAGEEAVFEHALQRMGEIVRIGDEPVAHSQCALGRLDEAVNVVEAFRLAHAKAREQCQDHQRDGALRRCVGVKQRSRCQADAQRFGEGGLVALEIGPRQGTMDALQVGGGLARDIATIEILKPGTGQMFKRGGECLLLEHSADFRNLAVDQKLLGETGHVFEPAELFLGQSFLTARDRCSRCAPA